MKGDILRKLRLDQKLTQKQLAEKLGISPSAVRMIELSKRGGSNEITEKIADYFNVSLDYLDGRSDLKKETINIREQMTEEFIDFLIEKGYVKDSNNIDEDTSEMILNFIKAKIETKLKDRKK